MKSTVRRGGRASLACLLLLAASAAPAPSARAADKLKPEEIVAKHLEAVGAAETRESIKNRIIIGAVAVALRAPSAGQGVGRAVFASQGEKNIFGMVFDNSPSYPFEKVGFDGREVTVSHVRPGVRSPLGNFLLTHKSVVRGGLLGGVLSQSWPLFGPAEGRGKLEGGGTKKVGDRQAYELKYTPKGGSDLNISLYFDAETFRHVRTEYTRTISAQMGPTPETSARQSETRYRLVEDYSDFRREAGLDLPHAYKLTLEIRSGGVSFDGEWSLTMSQFSFNQRLAPESFNAEAE